MITVTVKGLAELKSQLALYPTKVGTKIKEGLAYLSVAIKGKVIQHISMGTGMWKRPIDTGAMWQNIGAREEGFRAIVETSPRTPYAVYVHEGTSKMRARPFFEITADRERSYIEDVMNKKISEAVK
jgi:HK97 gp10 family phage protein